MEAKPDYVAIETIPSITEAKAVVDLLKNEFPGVKAWVSYTCKVCLFLCLMVFNTTFNNISVIFWRSVLLVEETTDLSQVTDKLYHIMLYASP